MSVSRYADDCPKECPAAPIQQGGAPIPCSMITIRTGSDKIKFVEQCSRCGYLNPQVLDNWADDAAKRSLNASQMRTAMAISGEPFTFVRSSDADITLSEAIGQALGAASMCWEHPEGAGTFDSERAGRIFAELYKLIQEKAVAPTA